MRKLLVVIAIISAMSLMGCAMGMSPVTGSLYTEVKGPLGATSNAGSAKMGTATAVSYLGAVAMGDASISAAMQNGGITRIHHIDYETKGILGLYAETTVKVYGE